MDAKTRKLKISLVLNIIIFIFTLLAIIMMFTGIKFSNGYEPVLETTKLGMFKFFTVDSNLFMGIISLIFVIFEILILKGKKIKISTELYILKLMSTTAVGLTFFVVFIYLGPISKGGILSMLRNSNLFLHLIIPVLSIITFVFFEKNNKLKFRDTFWGLVPTLLYAIFYLVNVIIHMQNWKVSPIYDWYWFVQNGVWTALIVAPIIIIITYGISLVLWKFNKLKEN